MGVDADTVCPPSCVTAAIDQGSAGIYNFDDLARHVLARTATRLYASLSITNGGVQMPPQEEIQDPACCDLDAIRRIFRRHPSLLVGLKIRVHAEATAGYGLAALHRAAQVSATLKGEGLGCRLTVHFGALAADVPLGEVLAALAPGDVLAHMYHETGSRLFGADGEPLACVLDARARGVLFDACDGLGHFSLRNLRRGIEGGFWPDLISTDIVRQTAWRQPGFSLMNKVTVYLGAGMPLMEAVRRVTAAPALAYGLQGHGALEEGAMANLAVFRLEERRSVCQDLFGGRLELERMAVPMATIRDGLVVFQQVFL